jgi:hypothetical protein
MSGKNPTEEDRRICECAKESQPDKQLNKALDESFSINGASR